MLQERCLAGTSYCGALTSKCGQAPLLRLRGAACQCMQQNTWRESSSVDRRSVLLGSLAIPAALTAFTHPQQLWTTADASTSSRQLPRGYEEFAGKLVSALREAIESDLSDAEEREVRRKADPAKDLVRTWIQTWRDAPGVTTEVSHTELTGTIKQLGEFYKKKGQRARLPRALGDDLLAKLATAENALPVSLNVRGEQRA